MKEENVIILAHKRLEGTISAAERRRLSDWENASAEQSAFVEEIELAWELSKSTDFAFQPNLDVAMSRFQKSLKDEQKVVLLNPTGFVRRRVLAVAAIAAAIAGVLFVWNPFTASRNWQEVATTQGEQRKVELADGSVVWLNGESTLSYPQTFGSKRLVRLSGEAFFDVAKDADHPFVVSANGADIKVLGTSFNVRSVATEQKVVVAVRSGKVRFEVHNSSQSWLLTQHDKFTFDLARKRFSQEKDDTENDWSWFSKQLQFKKTKLGQVLQALERHYRLQIELSNKDLYECRSYSGKFDHAKIEDILSALETTLSLNVVKRNDGSYLLKGGTCQQR
ncbi:MAG: FecR domain-containing protein [Bacteroidota bacterium]